MKILIVSILMLFSSTAFAASEIKVGVNGMVCGFCAQGITKKFTNEAAVSSIKVNLENKIVTLRLKDEKDLSDEKITTLLKESGYSVSNIERK
jgi:periplasmic mercuric ion binding protein